MLTSKLIKRSFSKYILAIDQGTTSSRAVLFNSQCKIVALHQKEHKQITPKPGWVEHNPLEIINSVKTCVHEVVKNAQNKLGISTKDIVSIGVTNQRETTIAWVFFINQKY